MGIDETRDGVVFYDLCCGSGAITVELLNRGWDPAAIVMVDVGPWGRIWRAFGEGSFDLCCFRAEIDAVPAEPAAVQSYLQSLANQPVDADKLLYRYLILQAGAFGGKAVWIDKDRWKTPGFRSYWYPTATSSRRSPVNPMMPMAETLYKRVAILAPRARGIRAFCLSVTATPWDTSRDGIVYLDPPYTGTTAYADTFDVEAFARSSPFVTWISEGRALVGKATRLSGERSKGGISGNRVGGNEEWLTRVG
jgi:16S rRNA G966 N2-methylase RsmD